jgi:hypothetical protein
MDLGNLFLPLPEDLCRASVPIRVGQWRCFWRLISAPACPRPTPSSARSSGSGLQGRCGPLEHGKESRIYLHRNAAGDGAVRLAFLRAWQLLFWFSASARLAPGRSLMSEARAAATVTGFATTVRLRAASSPSTRLARGRVLAYSRLTERRYNKPSCRKRYQSPGEARCALAPRMYPGTDYEIAHRDGSTDHGVYFRDMLVRIRNVALAQNQAGHRRSS